MLVEQRIRGDDHRHIQFIQKDENAPVKISSDQPIPSHPTFDIFPHRDQIHGFS
jgi:hypothetical protein